MTATIMLICHGCLFIYLRRKITRKKNILQRKNADLTRENEQLKGQLDYLIEQLESQD